jgi:hypothetical protein
LKFQRSSGWRISSKRPLARKKVHSIRRNAKSQPISSVVAPNDRSDADESKSVEIAAVQASTHRHAHLEGSIVQPRASVFAPPRAAQSFWRRGHAPPITANHLRGGAKRQIRRRRVQIRRDRSRPSFHVPSRAPRRICRSIHAPPLADTPLHAPELSPRAGRTPPRASHAPESLSARAIHAPSTDPGRFAPRASQTGLLSFRVRLIHSTVHGFRAKSAHTTDPNINPVQPIKPTRSNQKKKKFFFFFGSGRHLHGPWVSGQIGPHTTDPTTNPAQPVQSVKPV